jgi:hypothetical protein
MKQTIKKTPGKKVYLQKAKLKGGADRYCCCACAYANSGGSSTVDNRDANYDGGDGGMQSPQC